MCSPNDSRNGISSAEVSDQIIVCHMDGEDSVRRFQHPNDEVRIDTFDCSSVNVHHASDDTP